MPADPLKALLDRALARSAAIDRSRAAARGKTEEEKIAEDYAKRLAEKATFRRLLSDESQDGMRFRWYFTRINKSTPLDELRAWIDGRIDRDDTAV
jgi:hypothetical protein